MVQCSISISRICQPFTGLSSSETDLNGEHAVMHKLLRFYTFETPVDIAMLPGLLFWLQRTHLFIFYLFIVSRCLPGFLTLLLFATIFFIFTRINMQTQPFPFPVKWSSYRLLKAWSYRTLKVAGGYDNFIDNKAAAPSLHIKNTAVYRRHTTQLISSLIWRLVRPL